MGVIKRGILGGFQGKVANVVGSSWKGIDVMKSLPLSVANPNTAAQQTQRGKFASVVAFAKIILVSVIKPLWDRFAQGQSGYNAFVSTNIDLFDSDGLATPADLVISQGSLTGAPIALLTATNGDPTVTINWVNNGGSGSAVNGDLAYGVVYNETQNTVGYQELNNTRLLEAVNIEMPANSVTGNVIHAYLAFRRADGTLVSNTSYATVVV